MATAAQILANQSNARQSTGPKSEAGKARASRNSLKHGLTLGVLAMSAEESAWLHEFEAEMRPELLPSGVMEEEAFQQYLDGNARLHKVELLMDALCQKYNDAPCVVPEAAAEVRQLSRYRAAAEAIIYRAISTLREFQTTRLYRELHMWQEEAEYIPAMVRPPLQITVGCQSRSMSERVALYRNYGFRPFDGLLPKLPSTT